MKDFLGNEVSVGDFVFFKTSGRWPESLLGQVASFTNSGLPKVNVLKSSKKYSRELIRDRLLKTEFVIVTNQVDIGEYGEHNEAND